MLADPAPVPDEVLSTGVAPAPPEGGELDADEAGVEGLALPDLDAVAVALALAGVDGFAVAVGGHRVPVGVAAFLPPVALVLAFAEAVVVALLAAVALAVVVEVAVAVPVAVPVSLGLALPLAGLLLVPPDGLVAEPAGVTFGDADLAGLAAADDEEVDEHAVGLALLWPAEVRPWPELPPDEPPRLPDPARLGTPPLVLEEEIPTADPS